ncbi:MAG: hypothetical protein NWF04_04075 [Candidatus Bathyarchaeota archaeon]|nr:hypothetical protein [Candidatus Bathyarchaeota archaeon]
MTDNEKAVEVTMDKMEEIRKAMGDFKNNVASHLKDVQTDVKDWRFAVESHEEGVTVDVSVKLLIKQKTGK